MCVRKRTYLWLDNLQVPDLNPARCEIWNFKFDLDRSLSLTSTDTTHTASKPTHHPSSFVVITSNRWETEFCSHEKFLSTAKLLYFPNYGGGFWGVVDGADVCPEAWGIGVIGDGDDDADVVGCAASFELCFCLEFVSLDP